MRQLLVFSSPDCAPCKLLLSYLEEKSMPYAKIDVSTDEGARISHQYRTGRSVPVTILVENGAEVDRIIGFSGAAQVDRLWKSA